MRAALTALALAAAPVTAGPYDTLIARCMSCHIDEAGDFDIIGIRALQALPEEWQLLFEDAFDLDGDGAAGKVQYVSGAGMPLIAKWGENLAAARLEDFALIAGKAHGIAVSSPEALAAIGAAFEQRSPLPPLPFANVAERQRFEAAGCARCHVTLSFEFEGHRYMPLSDFLLHDMGRGPKRTTPLWGCGDCLWHDPHQQAQAR